jgi:hypothetical protein
MWEERLERRCRRNTQQESILKLLLLFFKSMILPFNMSPLFMTCVREILVTRTAEIEF